MDQRVKCLLLPLQNGTLLIPNSLVAEIVPAQRHEKPPAGSASWFLGTIEWRRMPLPLISLEGLCDPAEREFPAKSSFVVVRRLNPGAGRDYYAVYINGIPHFQFIGEDLPSLSSGERNEYVAHRVDIAGAQALIPDLDAVERAVDSVQVSDAPITL